MRERSLEDYRKMRGKVEERVSMQDETKSRMQEEDDRKWRGEKGAENRGSQMIVKVKSKGRKDRREAGRKEDIRRITRRSIWPKMQQCFMWTKRENANRIYVSHFPPNWHLSLFHTHSRRHIV